MEQGSSTTVSCNMVGNYICSHGAYVATSTEGLFAMMVLILPQVRDIYIKDIAGFALRKNGFGRG